MTFEITLVCFNILVVSTHDSCGAENGGAGEEMSDDSPRKCLPTGLYSFIRTAT